MPFGSTATLTECHVLIQPSALASKQCLVCTSIEYIRGAALVLITHPSIGPRTDFVGKRPSQDTSVVTVVITVRLVSTALGASV